MTFSVSQLQDVLGSISDEAPVYIQTDSDDGAYTLDAVDITFDGDEYTITLKTAE